MKNQNLSTDSGSPVDLDLSCFWGLVVTEAGLKEFLERIWDNGDKIK